MPNPTELNHEKLRDLFNNNVKINDIVKELKTSHRVVARTIKHLGLTRTAVSRRPAPSSFIGTKHGNLTVTGFEKHKNEWWAQIVCDCGNISKEKLRKLTRGLRITCGVLGCSFSHAVRARNGRMAGFTGHKEIYGARWAHWQCGAKKRDIPFTLKIEDAWDKFIAQGKRCALSGVLLTFGNSVNKEITASLDRIDSTQGYTNENIQWVHKRINVMKGAMSDDEFFNWCQLVADLRRTGNHAT